MSYPSYLVHFNKNHSKKNGQFVSGDGDGDGIANDHANQRKTYGYTKNGSKETEKLANKLATTSNMYGTPNYKLLNKFIESSRRDEDQAYANKDYELAKSIAAGRIYMRSLVDRNFRQRLFDSLSNNTDIVKPGEKFVASFSRDDKYGGITLTNNNNGKSTGISDSKYDYSDVDYYK